MIEFEIFRYNPALTDDVPRMASYRLDDEPYMTLYRALTRIREESAPDLQFDFVCRSAVCGSCGMLVNGRPMLACKTLIANLRQPIRLHPLPAFKLIGDLSVDTGTWFRGMNERAAAWIHASKPFDENAPEARMDDELAQAIYDADRCIECGCCVAGCGVANLRGDFLAPAGLNRAGRFMMDPRDTRSDETWFELIADDTGVFGCVGLMACEDVCPKELPLLQMHAYLRRRMLASAFADRT